jgi:alpha/beta hydrolase family protein
MAATQTAYRVLQLEEEAFTGEGNRRRVALRRELEIGAFGINAIYQAKAGEPVVNEHDETSPFAGGHEELYLVVRGGCTFTVEGDEFAAPAGAAVFVGDPAAKRKSVATEDGTIVVAIGGKRGEAYRPVPYDAQTGFGEAYNEKDYEQAIAILNGALEQYPGNAGLTYNLACMEALVGREDEALAHLEEALVWEPFKELAANDDDFASLRDKPEFRRLLA